ncbi:phosphoribosylformylglycinamidine synthase II [Candidatus Termititenax dinenymphae]|uniref:Phosphoribosylformylglycinamidine synthase subunit PurL n=1 Tax=Candidatus Termititenax dinenymphae TaxID=2218523 RepID=A0A388TMH5_9BACT|nr:phosphoribosylformylglycinamidine synthase II [Candidatus Termititenax dinenymphae]
MTELDFKQTIADTKAFSKKVLKEHGLTDAEYKRIHKILGRHPTITELGMYSVLWSEHCSYKHSKPLLKMFPTTGKYVLQGPGENAGIVDIGNGLALSFKIESHNHPSAVEPYQGAATGVGGIIRDIFTMGARPIASLNSLRFGSIGQDNPRMNYLFNGVVGGIAGYGNCIGIPTVAGEIYFSDSYGTNILVNAMCVGVVQSGNEPVDKLYGPIVRGKAAGIGNKVLYVGADTGRDGIHGATFASVEISKETEEKRSSVQVGDPFKEKVLLEACLELIKTGIVVGMQDMGAAGLTSSTSEMASRSNSGIDMYLDKVPQREKNMTPYEMLLSESQERMVVIVEKGKEQIAYDIFQRWGLHAVEIGEIVEGDKLRCIFQGEIVAEVPARSLADDAPVYECEETEPYYLQQVQEVKIETLSDLDKAQTETVLLKLLSTPNIASKRCVYEQYDHMVQTNTSVAPGIADAAVLRVKGSDKKIAMTTDCNARYAYLDPYTGGAAAMAEAVRNLACVGARPIGATDCLNFANPEKPENFWSMRRACQGIADACRAFETAIISGNVSMYNESALGPIYPTPVIGLVGVIEPHTPRITAQFQNVGDLIFQIGETSNALGGTEYLKIQHDMELGFPPHIDFEKEKQLQEFLINSIEQCVLSSAHDLSEGGLLTALAESAILSDKGAEIQLMSNKLRLDALLFAETQARAIVTISPDKLADFQKLVAKYGVSAQSIGKVVDSSFTVTTNGTKIVDLSLEKIADKYYNAIPKLLSGK